MDKEGERGAEWETPALPTLPEHILSRYCDLLSSGRPLSEVIPDTNPTSVNEQRRGLVSGQKNVVAEDPGSISARSHRALSLAIVGGIGILATSVGTGAIDARSKPATLQATASIPPLSAAPTFAPEDGTAPEGHVHADSSRPAPQVALLGAEEQGLFGIEDLWSARLGAAAASDRTSASPSTFRSPDSQPPGAPTILRPVNPPPSPATSIVRGGALRAKPTQLRLERTRQLPASDPAVSPANRRRAHASSYVSPAYTYAVPEYRRVWVPVPPVYAYRAAGSPVWVRNWDAGRFGPAPYSPN